MMDGNSICIDNLSSTSDSNFIPLPSKSLQPQSLCHLGSGTGVILDCEGAIEAESRKLPSSKYKGVVPQPNGRWGAQIYDNRQRVWIGTFSKEDEAATAYDIAAKRFRGRDAITNFKQRSDTEDCDLEAAFLNSHSKEEIVDMLRKHAYYNELEQSKRKYFNTNGSGNRVSMMMEAIRDPSRPDRAAMTCHLLFQKEVTRSDVGKLNRFVIPKQHAEKHFPLRNRTSPTTSKGVLLNFIDSGGKVWRFRYSYWNSSRSYVLTRGWTRFVKEKSLRTGDIVSFHRSAGPEKKLHIKCMRRSGLREAGPIHPVQMVRLFGVDIFEVSAEDGGGYSGGG